MEYLRTGRIWIIESEKGISGKGIYRKLEDKTGRGNGQETVKGWV